MGFARATVANRHNSVVRARYSAEFSHSKQHRGPLMNSQPRTKRTEHPQTPRFHLWARGDLTSSLIWQVKHIPQSLLDPKCNEVQEDFVIQLGWHPHSYRNTLCFSKQCFRDLFFFLNYGMSTLDYAKLSHQTDASSKPPCDSVVRLGWTQLKSVWILNLFLFICLKCLWKKGWRRKQGCSEWHKLAPSLSEIRCFFLIFIWAWKGWQEIRPCSEFLPWIYFFLMFLLSNGR